VEFTRGADRRPGTCDNGGSPRINDQHLHS
jgi:hypothetical protein